MNTRLTRSTLVLLIAATGGVAVLTLSQRGEATAPPKAVAFAQMDPTLRSLARSAGRLDSVLESSIYEVGGVGAGDRHASGLVGKSTTGDVMIALAEGRAIQRFRSERELFARDAIVMGVGIAGPSTEVRHVGVVGAVRPGVARVTVELADGVVVEMELSAGPIGRSRFFSWISDAPSGFPTVVRAYDSAGRLLARYDVDTKPLCPESNPGCLD